MLEYFSIALVCEWVAGSACAFLPYFTVLQCLIRNNQHHSGMRIFIKVEEDAPPSGLWHFK